MAYLMEHTVSSYDIDTNLIATPSAVMRYLLETVDANMKDCGPSYQDLFNSGRSFIVSRTALELIRPLREYEKLSVCTWATESKSATFPRSYLIEADGIPVAKCLMNWALLDLENGRLLRGDELDVSCYGTGDPIELSFPSRLRLPKDIPLTHCDSVKVSFRDIDRNFHMNNTKYFDLLFGCVPNFSDYTMVSCLMNYVSEAKLSDLIDIYISSPELTENGDVVYYFKTMVENKTNCEAQFTLRKIN